MTPTVISAAEEPLDRQMLMDTWVFLTKTVDEGQTNDAGLPRLPHSGFVQPQHALCMETDGEVLLFTYLDEPVLPTLSISFIFSTGWAVERMRTWKFHSLLTAHKKTTMIHWFIQLLCNSCIRSDFNNDYNTDYYSQTLWEWVIYRRRQWSCCLETYMSQSL